MDDSNVKIVKDLIKKNLSIVNKLMMSNVNKTAEDPYLTKKGRIVYMKKLNTAACHLAAAVEGVASLLMEHVMVPKEPETQIFTVVGYYPESNEIVVDHYEAANTEDAVNQFWADDDGDGAGEARRDGCRIVSVFHGRLYDLLWANLFLDEGPISFPQWTEATKKASTAKETPK